MKIITRTLLGLSLPALLLATGSSYATARLQNIDSIVQSSGKSVLRLRFDSKVNVPESFVMKVSSSVILDFPDAISSIGRSKKLNSKLIKKVRMAKGGKKLRVMISLNKLSKYTTSIQGNDVVLLFDNAINKELKKAKAIPKKAITPKKASNKYPKVASKSVSKASIKNNQKKHLATNKYEAIKKKQAVARRNARLQQQRLAIQKAQKQVQAGKRAKTANQSIRPVVKQKSVKRHAVASNYIARPHNKTARYKPTQKQVTYKAPARPTVKRHSNQLGIIDFHRTQNGGGRATIKLPSSKTAASSRKVGNSVILTIKETSVPQARKRIDVMDFATPASYIDIARNGRDVQIKIHANTAFDFEASKKGAIYTINFKKQKRKSIRTNPLKPKNKVYKGKKLSLNFQDIEVRSVLQLLADFTNKNIVVSDSVKGNITLRLKDVPWDQALDIVLESKGLAMRENGNVIWVAPAAELEAKEQRELQSLKRRQALEPLITEYISVNFAKAEDMAKLISSASTGNAGSGSLLSKRGSVSLDRRTNTLLIKDTANHINDIRSMVKNLDVAVRQVSIESRIVIATDEFSKDLGSRFGATGFNNNVALSGGISGSNTMVGDLISGSGTVSVPNVADRLNFNLPAATAGAAKMAISVLSKDFLLDLELSALQAENKGEIISTPRVVTANKKKAAIEQGVEIGYKTESRSGGTTVAFKKAVLRLEVTPQITPDDHVIMDLAINQDTVGDIIEGVPSINTREVNTQVLVDNGQTVVLGGVHEEVNSNKVEKVPMLGDVPVIGNLFKRTIKKDQKRELLIFVTPKILK